MPGATVIIGTVWPSGASHATSTGHSCELLTVRLVPRASAFFSGSAAFCGCRGASVVLAARLRRFSSASTAAPSGDAAAAGGTDGALPAPEERVSPYASASASASASAANPSETCMDEDLGGGDAAAMGFGFAGVVVVAAVVAAAAVFAVFLAMVVGVGWECEQRRATSFTERARRRGTNRRLGRARARLVARNRSPAGPAAARCRAKWPVFPDFWSRARSRSRANCARRPKHSKFTVWNQGKKRVEPWLWRVAPCRSRCPRPG